MAIKSPELRPALLEEELADLSAGWKDRLFRIKREIWFNQLCDFTTREIATSHPIFPAKKNWLKALREVPFEKVRVVILGQDPYPNEGQAIGVAFGVPNGLSKKPPSLSNIFKEVESDTQERIDPQHSDLSGWTHQGVLLLNSILTLRKGLPLSHQGQGWECFTDTILDELNQRSEPIVFMLWGLPAQKKRALITRTHHLVLEAPHPSPLSAYRGFFGCKHFSQTNTFLKKRGSTPIQWGETSFLRSSD